jgi:signal peptide peptidase SppA
MDKLIDLLNRPILAIEESAFRRLVTGCTGIMLGNNGGASEAFRPSAEAVQRTAVSPKRLMVIPIEGVLTNDDPWYGTTYTQIQSALARAAEDPSIEGVILHVDSPGGETTGLQETAAAIANLSKVKPVRAMVTGMAASAAYWLVSQATDITLTPSGEVGSVGVRATHVDISEALDSMGVNVTEMHAGKYKTEFSPFAPLSEESKAYMQGLLDNTHQKFQDAIASGRGARVSKEMTASKYGDARLVSAADAKAHGLVDHLASTIDFYRPLAPASSDLTGTRAEGVSPERGRLSLEVLKHTIL